MPPSPAGGTDPLTPCHPGWGSRRVRGEAQLLHPALLEGSPLSTRLHQHQPGLSEKQEFRSDKKKKDIWKLVFISVPKRKQAAGDHEAGGSC